MKIYHKVDYWKGYIPSDKIHYNHIPFEHFSITNFGISYKTSRKYRNGYNTETKNEIIEHVKNKIKTSKLYKEIIEEGYHTALYLNFNFDGIDCFISR